MNKKQYLRQGYNLRRQIENEQEILKELKSNLDGLRGITTDSDKISGGPLKDDSNLVFKIDRIIELEKKIESKITRLKDFQAKLYIEIERLENTNERILMNNRYILNLTWEQIAERLGYSVRQILRIHQSALENFKIIS